MPPTLSLQQYQSQEELNKAFLAAVRKGNEEVVATFLKLPRETSKGQGICLQINTTESLGNLEPFLPIHDRKDYRELTNQLIAEGANGDTGLHIAAKKGYTNIVHQLLAAGANYNLGARVSDQRPIHYAVYEGHVTVVEAFLDFGVNVNLCDGEGHTALHWASGQGQDAVVDLLLARGADVNLPDIHGDTPLVWAADLGNDNIMEELLRAGACPLKKYDRFLEVVSALIPEEKRGSISDRLEAVQALCSGKANLFISQEIIDEFNSDNVIHETLDMSTIVDKSRSREKVVHGIFDKPVVEDYEVDKKAFLEAAVIGALRYMESELLQQQQLERGGPFSVAKELDSRGTIVCKTLKQNVEKEAFIDKVIEATLVKAEGVDPRVKDNLYLDLKCTLVTEGNRILALDSNSRDQVAKILGDRLYQTMFSQQGAIPKQQEVSVHRHLRATLATVKSAASACRG